MTQVSVCVLFFFFLCVFMSLSVSDIVARVESISQTLLRNVLLVIQDRISDDTCSWTGPEGMYRWTGPGGSVGE